MPASRPLALKGIDLMALPVVLGAGVDVMAFPVVLGAGVVPLCGDPVGMPERSFDPQAARTMTRAAVRAVRRMSIAEKFSNTQPIDGGAEEVWRAWVAFGDIAVTRYMLDITIKPAMRMNTMTGSVREARRKRRRRRLRRAPSEESGWALNREPRVGCVHACGNEHPVCRCWPCHGLFTAPTSRGRTLRLTR